MTRLLAVHQLSHTRRQVLGIAMTAVASVSTIATSTGRTLATDVRLPTETIVLSQSSPVHVSRFRVETTYDAIRVDATLVMAEPASPTLAVELVGASSGEVRRTNTLASEFDADHASVEIVFGLRCPKGTVCVYEFETSGTAQELSANDVAGAIDVTVQIAGSSSDIEKKYLSVEPL